MVKLTRKHHEAIHPKHLLRDNKEHYWYDDHVRGARRVLDVGCNQGMHAIHAASLAGEVIGLDQDEQALYVAHFNARWESRRNLTLVVGDAGLAWPFADAAFDCVMAFDVVEHVVDRDRFYAELRRVLVPGGKALLSAPNADTAYKRMKKSVGMRYYCDPTHVIEYSLEELKAECLKGGFETLAVAPVVYDAPLYGLFDFLGGLSLPLYERFERYKRQSVVRRPEDTTGYRLVLRRADGVGVEDRPGQ
jgi:SAM-dependent methyltransferase